jgi:methylglutaconyl-CoA hydratase
VRLERLELEFQGPVARVWLNRPDVRNAFDEEMIAGLTAWARSPQPAGARVAILQGSGRTFCAGADLTWMARTIDYSRDDNLRDARAMADMFHALDTLPLPLVGRVHGAALGGGAGLAAVCDIVVAAENAVFGFTEAKLGILPAVISPFAVAKIGVSAARELFLTAARFPAERARQIGLVHAIVPEAELDAAVATYVREILSSAPQAVSAAKQLIANVAHRPPASVIDLTVGAIADRRTSTEGQAGMRAFLNRTRAPWIDDEAGADASAASLPPNPGDPPRR